MQVGFLQFCFLLQKTVGLRPPLATCEAPKTKAALLLEAEASSKGAAGVNGSEAARATKGGVGTVAPNRNAVKGSLATANNPPSGAGLRPPLATCEAPKTKAALLLQAEASSKGAAGVNGSEAARATKGGVGTVAPNRNAGVGKGSPATAADDCEAPKTKKLPLPALIGKGNCAITNRWG